jgi:AraC-like DNA-binding protein
MIYRKFTPDPILASFVECYFAWESGDLLKDELVVESPPSGFCSIVFNCGDIYHLQNKKYDRLIVPKQFISGQSIYSYRLFLSGNISIVGIVFKPAALATLYDLPVFEYTEERIDLSKVFDADFVKDVSKKILESSDMLVKIRQLEEFTLRACNHQLPPTDYIDDAANLIVERNGLLHVNELMKNIYMSRRNFERRFFKKVGLSPKYYARIRRIGYLMNLIAGKKKVDWSALFSECEFYDQSHFIKDFLEFTGRTPQQYLEENAELANLVDKPKQEKLN